MTDDGSASYERGRPLRLAFAPGRTLLFLLIVIATLALLHVAVMYTHYRVFEVSHLIRDLFDLDEEQAFGTWFSAAQLGFAGFLVLAISLHASTPERMRNYWLLLGLGLCFLSLDEVAGLHETLNSMIEFSWTLPGAILAAVVGLAFIPFVISLPSRTRWLFILAGVIYLGGALGAERVGHWFADEKLMDTLDYQLSTALEEAMEMAGIALFLYAVLTHVADAGKTKLDIEVTRNGG